MKTVSIFQYAEPKQIAGLCLELNMPHEVTTRLLEHLRGMDLDCFNPWFNGLFSPDTGGEAVKRIPELCKTDEDHTGDSGLKALAIYIAAALHTRNLYDEMGIERKVFYDTIKIFPRFVREHMQSYGCFGFDRHFWIYRPLATKLFRLGTLEYEMYCFPENIEPAGPVIPGASALFTHIPSDAILDREALDSSYRMAREFFMRHFFDFDYKCVYCSTWLLSPALREILKAGSRILLFQDDYHITKVDMTVNGGLKWVFKRPYDNFSLLPEDTSLMRGMKKILVSGGKTGTAEGYVRDFWTK